MATFYSAYSNGYRLILEVTQTSQDQTANKSYLSWVLKMSAGASHYQNSNTKDGFKVVINGKTVYNSSKAMWFDPYTTLTVASGSNLEVAHNTDGSKTVAVSFSFSPARTASYYPAAMSGSGSFTLTTILRQATIVSAPNFNDEANPTITYSNPLGDAVTSLQACISLDGSKDDVPYRDVSKTGTSYAFNLTNEERNTLRAAVVGGNSRTVIFYLRTEYNGATYHSTSYKTLTIINGAPVITDAIAVDTNPTTLNLTKNNQIFIKGYNTVNVSMTATPLKGATITSTKIYCGGVGVNAASGTLNNVEGRTVVFEATDSRGNTTTYSLGRTLIDYFEPTCALEAGTNNAAGSLSFSVKGQMFTDSFGGVNNSYGVQYRLKEVGGEWSDWVLFTMNAVNGAYTSQTTISIDYQKRYELQARVFDELSIIESNTISIAKAIPVFDWGEDDFSVNVDLNVEGDVNLKTNGALRNNEGAAIITNDGANTNIYGDNVYINGLLMGKQKIIWTGKYNMHAEQRIDLPEKISDQAHGIVLVFSRYNSSTGEAMNESFSCHFLPKQVVPLTSGCGFNFNLIGMWANGMKYIYVTDTYLRGHANNTAEATYNGIAYKNNYYVLRYVIGV